MVNTAASDGPGLGPMEFFLLALIGRRKLTSLYSLRTQAALEAGAIRPALTRLERNEMITREDPGRRRRRALALTERGKSLLENSWPNCLREEIDAEAVLRAGMVAWLMDGPAAAADYLRRIAGVRGQKAQKMMNEAVHLERSQTEPLSSYAWMRASYEAHRRRAESEAFLSMSRSIEESFTSNGSKATQSTVTFQ